MTVQKKVTLQLSGLNGNSFSLLGAFQRQAKHEHWATDEINDVLNEATAGSYHHLLRTLMDHCDDPDTDDRDDEGGDE